MIATEQQLISVATDILNGMGVDDVLNLVEVPAGHTVEAALIGWSTPLTDTCGLFLHFAPLDTSKLDSFTAWGREADVVIDFYESCTEHDYIDDIMRRWPQAVVYRYSCRCCNDDPPRLYLH